MCQKGRRAWRLRLPMWKAWCHVHMSRGLFSFSFVALLKCAHMIENKPSTTATYFVLSGIVKSTYTHISFHNHSVNVSMHHRRESFEWRQPSRSYNDWRTKIGPSRSRQVASWQTMHIMNVLLCGIWLFYCVLFNSHQTGHSGNCRVK